MDKLCLSCNAVIRGRSDKKYCGDGCRNAYHNSQNSPSNALVRNTNRILKKNYRILKKVPLEKGKGKISKRHLVQQGFIFELFTSVYKTQQGSDYFFVYDLGYLKITADLFVVVQKFKQA